MKKKSDEIQHGQVLTKMQLKILNYIENCVSSKGYPPSVREIGEAVGLKSPSTVHTHLQNLEKKGHIRRDSTKPRAIEIMKENYEDNIKDENENLNKNYKTEIKKYHNEITEIPILGRISAGTPIPAYEEFDEYFPIPVSLVSDGNYYMLKIRGDSMINAGILDGDYVIIRQQVEVKDGDMVAALIGDDATVKTFYKEDGFIRLQPENNEMQPILVKDVVILGKVKGVFRVF